MPQNITHQKQKIQPDIHLIKDFLRQQAQQLQLDERRLLIEEQRIQQDGKLAEQSLHINSQLLKEAPSQKRKTIITISAVSILVIVIFLIFITYCISNGKEDFVKTFLNWLSHIVSIGIGIWVGRSTARRKSKENNNSNFSEAEMIE